VNGYADDDGCPDAEQIRVLGDKIVLDDRVHFMVNMHIIRAISYPLLERLAKLINEHPSTSISTFRGTPMSAGRIRSTTN